MEPVRGVRARVISEVLYYPADHSAGTLNRNKTKDLNLGKKIKFLIVLAPRMTAFGATEEPDLAFIGGTELAEPPYCEVVLALRTLDLDGRHGFFLPFLFHDHDFVLASAYLALHLVSHFDLPDITTFPALQLATR